MRVVQPDDRSYCMEEGREYYAPGSVSDIFFQSMIRQLSRIFPDALFHLFVNFDEKIVTHYKADNIVIHNMTSLADNLHHFITADILVMSKSALSKMSACYRFGPSLMRNKHWADHYEYSSMVIVRNDQLSPEQLSKLKDDVMRIRAPE
jgi:hypothetical protein